MRNVLFGALAALYLLSTSARGQDADVGTHMACDTQAQITQVIAEFHAHPGISPEEAAAAINARKAHSCEIVIIAFTRTREADTIAVSNGVMHIIEIHRPSGR
jgi:hypothetical protein